VNVVTLAAGSRAAAEDAVHEALARAWERGGIERLDRWVLTVAMNLTRSRWRKLGRETPLHELPMRAVEDSVEDIDVLNELRRLPRSQREVAALYYLLDLPVAEIAQLTGLSEGGAKHALFRARRTLAATLTPDVAEEVTP
jgi:RNA polymerase sigma factor (sigma-70 family)